MNRQKSTTNVWLIARRLQDLLPRLLLRNASNYVRPPWVDIAKATTLLPSIVSFLDPAESSNPIIIHRTIHLVNLTCPQQLDHGNHRLDLSYADDRNQLVILWHLAPVYLLYLLHRLLIFIRQWPNLINTIRITIDQKQVRTIIREPTPNRNWSLGRVECCKGLLKKSPIDNLCWNQTVTGWLHLIVKLELFDLISRSLEIIA